MKIEKINDNKIKITLDISDLEENNIDLHSFLSNSDESKELFTSMLDKAEKEVGFVTDDYKVMIEALATSDGTFVLTVTRLAPPKSSESLKTKKLSIKRKQPCENNLKIIYCFDNFDEFCNFCDFAKTTVFAHLDGLSDKTSLYEFNTHYYLVITNLHINNNLLKTFLSLITEFARYVNNPELFEAKLAEFGNLIINESAISIGIKYFTKQKKSTKKNIPPKS